MSTAKKKTTASRRQNRPSPRTRLLNSATKLFDTEGIRVIGIDRILRDADVAKASLYSLFGSKDALVTAYIEKLDEDFREDWQQRTAELTNVEDKLLAFFDKAIDDEPKRIFAARTFSTQLTNIQSQRLTLNGKSFLRA